MRVVIDTNVIVSGLLKPYGAPGEIIRMLVSGVLEVCYDARIISEYREVLHRDKFKLDKGEIEEVIRYIENRGCSIASRPIKDKANDRNDQMFLEVAVCSKAECLITGNKVDYPLHIVELRIKNPKEFLDSYGKY